MRKTFIIIFAIGIGVILSLALGRLISQFLRIHADYFVVGTGRLLEFRVRDENNSIVSSVGVDVELKKKIDEKTYDQLPDELKQEWKDKRNRIVCIRNIQHHPDGTISVAFAPMLGENQRVEPDYIILYLHRMGNIQQKRKFTLEELNGKYYIGTRDKVRLDNRRRRTKQDNVKVYRVPDFILESDEEL